MDWIYFQAESPEFSNIVTLQSVMKLEFQIIFDTRQNLDMKFDFTPKNYRLRLVLYCRAAQYIVILGATFITTSLKCSRGVTRYHPTLMIKYCTFLLTEKRSWMHPLWTVLKKTGLICGFVFKGTPPFFNP